MRLTRLRLSGIFAALLALMVQVAIGATVPQPDPVASVLAVETFCHAETPTDGSGHKTPPLDCLVCPFCVAVHAQAMVALPDVPVVPLPGLRVVPVAASPGVAAPPPPQPRPPGQPRAPPSA